MRVSENTPLAYKVGAKTGARTGSKSEVQVLRSQIANLLKEKQQLELQVSICRVSLEEALPANYELRLVCL